ASDLSKSKADLICTGANDQAVIAQALGMLPTSPRQMGRIVVAEGSVYLSGGTSTDLFDVGSNRHIMGMGRLNTRLLVAGDATTTSRVLFDLRDGSLLSDLTIERDPSFTLGTNSYIAVGLFGARWGIRNVDIDEGGGTSGSAPTAVWAFGTTMGFIDGCFLAAPDTNILINGVVGLHVTDNRFESSGDAIVLAANSDDMLISDNLAYV